jgi:hypothetical protein
MAIQGDAVAKLQGKASGRQGNAFSVGTIVIQGAAKIQPVPMTGNSSTHIRTSFL